MRDCRSRSADLCVLPAWVPFLPYRFRFFDLDRIAVVDGQPCSIGCTLNLSSRLSEFLFYRAAFHVSGGLPEDIAGLIAFLVTSLIVTSLVSRSRKLADLAIASQKETLALKDQLQLIIDTTPALVWSALPDGSNDFVNRGWVEFTRSLLGRHQGLRLVGGHPSRRSPRTLGSLAHVGRDGQALRG